MEPDRLLCMSERVGDANAEQTEVYIEVIPIILEDV